MYLKELLAGGLLISGSALAQNQFLPIGSQIMDGTQNLVTVNLGFNFTMPGGTVVTSVDVDEHGRIVEVGSDATDSSESTAEMTGNPGASINVNWDFVSYPTGAGVWFDTDSAGLAVITWVDVNTPSTCTYQCQLYGDGRIVMVYDDRCPEDDGITALCPGNGVTLPAQTDLSSSIGASIASTDATVFEDFGFSTGIDTFDLIGAAIEYIPTGAGWTVVGELLPFAQAETFGQGCSGSPVGSAQYELFGANPFDLSNTGHTYTWSGTGYDLTDGAGAIVPPTNTATAFGDDDIQPVVLGFSMPSPSGLVSDVAVCSNGWMTFDATVTDTDLSETVSELLNDSWSRIAFLWDDLDPTAGGTINLEQVGPGEFHITFTDIQEFGTAAGANNCQIALFDNGNVEVRYAACTILDGMVGCSAGYGSNDLGGVDYSSPGGAVAVPTGVAPFTPPLNLGSNTPKIDTNWDLTLTNVEAVLPDAFFFFGDMDIDPGVDLTPFGGAGCFGYTNANLGAFMAPITAGTANFMVAVPNNTALIGAELSVQGTAAAAGIPWGFSTSNGLRGVVGL